MIRPIDSAASSVCRVERARSRLGRLHRGLRRHRIAQLPDQDHVRIGTQRSAQGLLERGRVQPDFTLVDDALRVSVEELDRVFDRDDVTVPCSVDVPDDRGERGRLARSGRPRAEDQAPMLLGEQRDALGKAEVAKDRDVAWDQAEGEEIAPRCRKPLTRNQAGRPACTPGRARRTPGTRRLWPGRAQ